MSHVRRSGRKRSPWRAEVPDPATPSGKVSKSFGRRGDARDWATSRDREKLDGTYITPGVSKVVFRERWDVWVKAALHQRDTTKDRESSYARSLVLPTFGEVPLDEITFDMVEAWVAELAEANYAASTIHKAHQVLSKVLAHSVRSRKIHANAAAGVTLPSVTTQVQRILSDTEIAAASNSLGAWGVEEQLWFLVSVFGGLRAEESFALRAGRVDRSLPDITVLETVVETSKGLVWGQPKTKSGKRRVELPPFVWEQLVEHISGMKPDQLVFTSVTGEVVRLHNFRSRVWQRAAIDASLGRIMPCERLAGAETCVFCKPGSAGAKRGHYVGPNIHDLRHTAVSLWIKLGSNPLQVMERAGHSKIAFTYDRYGHLFPNDRDPMMERLDTFGRNLFGTAAVTPLRSVS